MVITRVEMPAANYPAFEAAVDEQRRQQTAHAAHAGRLAVQPGTIVALKIAGPGRRFSPGRMTMPREDIGHGEVRRLVDHPFDPSSIRKLGKMSLMADAHGQRQGVELAKRTLRKGMVGVFIAYDQPSTMDAVWDRARMYRGELLEDTAAQRRKKLQDRIRAGIPIEEYPGSQISGRSRAKRPRAARASTQAIA